MLSITEHCAISKKRTGKDYKELHEWIYQPKDYLGVNHRIERHADSESYRTFITKEFGDRAVIEWLFHIAIDNLQTCIQGIQ
jgi:hypothetical protein